MSGYVYFITTAEADRVKIGFTSNSPASRLRELQTGSPFELCIIATECGSLAREQELHRRFAEHRLHGEWFEMCDEIRLHVRDVNRVHFAEAELARTIAPYWVRVFNALECGATPEEANAA
jgi:hypothetical protein